MRWRYRRTNIKKEDKNDLHLDRLVQAEKLQLLYNQSFPAIFASLFTGVLLCAILWPVQQNIVLISWFSILTLSALGRFVLFVRYWQLAPQGESVLAWEKPYFATLLLSTLIWGIGSVIIMPANSIVHQAIIYYFLVGLSGGAIAVYSAHRFMTLATIACIMLPITMWFLSQGTLLSVGMSLGAIVFFITVIRAGKVLSQTMHQSFMLTHKLKESNEIAENLARMDELTGLGNRRAFYEHGHLFTSYCQRHGEMLSMILIDIDHFKKVNDTLGHAAGDAALKQIGLILQQSVRSTDICARIGGEEFGILLLASTMTETAQSAERIRQTIAKTSVSFNEENFTITASLGVTMGCYDLDTLFKCADAALYQAKQTGRNSVVCDRCATE